MKKKLKLTAVLAMTFAIIQTGVLAQTYVMPGQTLNSFGPMVFTPGNSYVGSLNWGGMTLSNTANINPTAITIQQSGTIYIPPVTASAYLMETESITYTNFNPFPIPPTIVSSNITADLTVTMNFAGGAFNYTTATEPLVWNGSTYSFKDELARFTVPMSLSYSLVTGGETYFSSDLNANLLFELDLDNQLDTSDYPTSIALGPDPTWVSNIDSSINLGGLIAADGFQQPNIKVGLVPEPRSWALLGLALTVMKFSYRRKVWN